MKNLSTTLNLLERLQQQFEKTVEKGPGELFFNLGINYLHSTIERIVAILLYRSMNKINCYFFIVVY